jgi:phosphatidylserine decarboxylase
MHIFFIIILVLILSCLAFYNFWFLRTPKRTIPKGDDLLISPANGKIIAILEVEKDSVLVEKKHRPVLNSMLKGFGKKATMISIMMTPMHVHYQRAPYDALLIEQNYKQGKFLNAVVGAESLDATFQNEYNEMLFETKDGVKFKVIQIAGFLARRIESFIKPNQSVIKGEHIGVIKLGSQITVIVDENIEVTAEMGETVIDGESVLGKIKK